MTVAAELRIAFLVHSSVVPGKAFGVNALGCQTRRFWTRAEATS